jgi:glutamine amidotransferase
MIGIIDYSMGNLKSVEKAFAAIGEQAFVSASPEMLSHADRLILPGVGAFDDALMALNQSGLTGLIRQAVSAEIPLLGICLGMQLLLNSSEETPNADPSAGLGLIPGRVVRIPAKEGFKIPQIGWNSLVKPRSSRLLDGIESGEFFYFVHSYYCSLENRDDVIAQCEYTALLDVALERGNLFAVQFHPEKSGNVGLSILKNFARL